MSFKKKIKESPTYIVLALIIVSFITSFGASEKLQNISNKSDQKEITRLREVEKKFNLIKKEEKGNGLYFINKNLYSCNISKICEKECKEMPSGIDDKCK